MALKQACCNLKLIFYILGRDKRQRDNPAFTKVGMVGMYVLSPRGVQVLCDALAFGRTELKSKWQHFEWCDGKHKAEIKSSEYL